MLLYYGEYHAELYGKVTEKSIILQLTVQMDLLELHLKLEKLDPAQVPETSVAHNTKAFQKMNADWTEVETKGKQFVADCKEVSKICYCFCLYVNS